MSCSTSFFFYFLKRKNDVSNAHIWFAYKRTTSMGNIMDKVSNTQQRHEEVAVPAFELLSQPDLLSLPSSPSVFRFITLSDTHNLHRTLTIPPGDVLIHCGDFTNHSTSLANAVDFIE